MNKTLLIIQREYLTRVKQKSFIIMTLLGPLLFALLMIVPVWIAMNADEKKKIEVIDETTLFYNLSENENIQFDYPPIKIEQAKQGLFDTDYDAILYIPSNLISGGNTVKIYYKKQLGISTEEFIKKNLEKTVYTMKLIASKIDINTIKSAETDINVITERQAESGSSERTSTTIYMAIGLAGGILIYIFIFMYGSQVMRGVMEEKTSRIIEVILSSVKPFQLMMGKIVGVALVGLTQFVLWAVLTFSISTFIQATFLNKITSKVQDQAFLKEQVFKKGSNLEAIDASKKNNPGELLDLFENLKSVDFLAIGVCFLIYFLGGYLLYSALFAAIGAAVDNETDSQQFMLPITIPLILSFVLVQVIIQNPEGKLALWLSLFPLTSPIIMMVRLPFGVPFYQIALSIFLLVLGFIGTVWLAAKIYRTGILLYGKKITYKELWKWIRYKE